jgi:hypothetical protein
MLRLLGALTCAAALAAPALGAPQNRTLAARPVLARGAYGQFGVPSNPTPVPISLRGGAMVAPRGAGLAGVDIPIPSIALLDGWEGRLDADVIFKANFADISTVVPVTFDQIRYAQDVSGRSLYFGAGVGALLGGKAKLIGKGVLGVELNARLGVEGNIIFTDAKTMVTVVGRLHL